MALVKCKECGEQVSTTAQSCPKCGAKPPKKTSLAALVVLGVIVIGVFAAVRNASNSPGTSSGPATDEPTTNTPAIVVKPQWETTTSVDKISGAKNYYATSPAVAPDSKMDSPYSDVKAWLGVGCDGKDEWAFVGFTTAPNLLNTNIHDGYSTINTRVKWGQTLATVALTQKWGAPFLQFEDRVGVIANIRTAASALLELDWYGENQVIFTFPLDGAVKAINATRGQCGSQSGQQPAPQ
jgi:zinc-ribbon domain